MTRVPQRIALLLQKIAGPLLIIALIATAYGAYNAYQINSDLANGIVKCGEKVMPDDPDVVCKQADSSRYALGSTRAQVRANNEEQAQRDTTLAIVAGIVALLAGGALLVARQSLRAHAGGRTGAAGGPGPV